MDAGLALPTLALALDPWRRFVDSFKWGWHYLFAEIVLAALFGSFRRYSLRKETGRVVTEFMEHMGNVTQLGAKHRRETEAHHGTVEVGHTVAVMLEALCKATRQILRIPAGIHVHANLMVRMPVLITGRDGAYEGCGIVQYSLSMPARPSYTRVARGDFGAGMSIAGAVQVVEDTRDPIWRGVFSRLRCRSFVSLPVEGKDHKIVGIVNIDSSRPVTFTNKNVDDQLHPAISTALIVLAETLQDHRH